MTDDLPFVSILVPTQDRRRFLPQLLRGLASQTHPATRLEVVVIDDGRDPVHDALPEALPGGVPVRYRHLDRKIPLGAKRNLLCEMAEGEVLVHMDDDDWYPPERVARAVARLAASGAPVVGKSELAFWDQDTDRIHQYPRIGDKHAHAGTMAYQKDYWRDTKWAPDPHAEERQFLRCWDVELAQLEGSPWDTVLCIHHGDNTLPKNTAMPVVPVRLDDVVNPEALAFYRSLEPEDW